MMTLKGLIQTGMNWLMLNDITFYLNGVQKYHGTKRLHQF